MKTESKSTKMAQQLRELLDVWEVPVTVAELRAAMPDVPVSVFSNALKRLTEEGLLYTERVAQDAVFYFPVAKKPRCAIQEFLCKGKLDGGVKRVSR